MSVYAVVLIKVDGNDTTKVWTALEALTDPDIAGLNARFVRGGIDDPHTHSWRKRTVPGDSTMRLSN